MRSIFQRTYTNPNPISVKDQACAAKAEAEKIKTCESFDELKKWACPKAISKNKNWYMTCIDCKGTDNCKCGKRVLELLEEQTKPTALPHGNVGPKTNRGHLAGREACLEATKHDDPIAYLMKANGINRAAARERFRRWKTMYPDIMQGITLETLDKKSGALTMHQKLIERITAAFSDPEGPVAYLMRVSGLAPRTARTTISNWAVKYPDLNERFGIREWLNTHSMKKRRNVKMDNPVVTSDADEMTLDELFAESGVKPATKKSNNDLTKYSKDNAARKCEAARKKIIDAFESEEDPISYIMRIEGTTYVKARSRIYTGARSYPDLEEKYHIFQWLKDHQKPTVQKRNKTEVVSVEEKPEPQQESPKLSNLDIVCAEMSKKRVSIIADIEDRKKRIADLESKVKDHYAEIDQLRKDLEAMDKVAQMLGLRPKKVVEH